MYLFNVVDVFFPHVPCQIILNCNKNVNLLCS